MGKEDALRGCVSWLVEPCDGNHIHRLVKSTHHLGAEALANTHRLSLAALVYCFAEAPHAEDRRFFQALLLLSPVRGVLPNLPFNDFYWCFCVFMCLTSYQPLCYLGKKEED